MRRGRRLKRHGAWERSKVCEFVSAGIPAKAIVARRRAFSWEIVGGKRGARALVEGISGAGRFPGRL